MSANTARARDLLMAALAAIGRLGTENTVAYFQMDYNALREPMVRALEALVSQQTGSEATLPPFVQRFIDRGRLEGELNGKRDALLRLLARAGITLTEEDRARIQACTDPATLDRWFDNGIGAKTVADVFS